MIAVGGSGPLRRGRREAGAEKTRRQKRPPQHGQRPRPPHGETPHPVVLWLTKASPPIGATLRRLPGGFRPGGFRPRRLQAARSATTASSTGKPAGVTAR